MRASINAEGDFVGFVVDMVALFLGGALFFFGMRRPYRFVGQALVQVSTSAQPRFDSARSLCE
jgi:uncharacterized membrane protein YdjX (TVP38/TMEM64 family)